MIICPQSPFPDGFVGNGITELCPTPARIAGLFSEIILDGNLVIPPQKPPKQHIVKVTHQVRINDAEVITVNIPPVPPATLGTTGYKVLVSGIITLTIQYVADVPDQKVHLVHYDIPFNTVLLDDCGAPLTTPPTNFVIHVCVEKIRVAQIDNRTLSKQVLLMVWLEERQTTCGIPDCRWQEYPSNPVYQPATPAYYQTVRYDQLAFAPFGTSDFYKMWYDYASTGGIALATSPDGVNWTLKSNMVGLSATARHSRVLFSRDGFGINAPYRIWYWDSPNPYIAGPQPQMIRTARSVDGVTWTNDTIITQDPSDPLLPFSIYNGSYGPADILYFPQNSSSTIDKINPFNNRYVMYYDVTNGSIEEIALAVSADGVFWARIGNQPVLPRGGPGQWDENYACEHAVVLRLAPNNFKMWYSGGVNSSHEGIGCATSTDGIHWTKFSGNPILSVNDGVVWRNGRTYNPWVLFDSSRFGGHGDSVCYKFWLTGATTTGNPDIGYATNSNG